MREIAGVTLRVYTQYEYKFKSRSDSAVNLLTYTLLSGILIVAKWIQFVAVCCILSDCVVQGPCFNVACQNVKSLQSLLCNNDE